MSRDATVICACGNNADETIRRDDCISAGDCVAIARMNAEIEPTEIDAYSQLAAKLEASNARLYYERERAQRYWVALVNLAAVIVPELDLPPSMPADRIQIARQCDAEAHRVAREFIRTECETT